MAVIRLRYEFATIVGSLLRLFANPFVAPQLTLTNDPVGYAVTVPFGGTPVTVWNEDGGGANPATFVWLALKVDEDIELEFTHEALASTTQYSVFTLAGGYVPFVLGSQVSRAGTFSGDALTNGTVGRITKIRAKNSSSDMNAILDVEIGA